MCRITAPLCVGVLLALYEPQTAVTAIAAWTLVTIPIGILFSLFSPFFCDSTTFHWCVFPPPFPASRKLTRPPLPPRLLFLYPLVFCSLLLKEQCRLLTPKRAIHPRKRAIHTKKSHTHTIGIVFPTPKRALQAPRHLECSFALLKEQYTHQKSNTHPKEPYTHHRYCVFPLFPILL